MPLGVATTLPTLRQEPQVIAAGDFLRWYKSLNSYSANEWTLRYIIRSKSNMYKWDATNSNGVFLVEVSSETTATWKPGNYAIGAWVVQGSGPTLQQKRVRTAFGNMMVTADLAVNPQGEDPTPWAAKMLAEVEKTLLALSNRTVQAATVNGSTYTLQNIQDLYKFRNYLRSEVRQLEEQARLDAGLGARNKIGVRFRSVAQQGWSGWYNYGAPWQ